MGVIYGLCDPDTGEVRYVGKTVRDPRKRLSAHLCEARNGGDNYKDRWIRSLDAPPEVTILERDPVDLDAAECAWIAFFRERGRLTNLTEGGDGMSYPRPEVIAKMAASMRGKRHSAETRARQSAAHRRRYADPAERLKLSVAHRKRYEDPAERVKTATATKRGRAKMAPEELSRASRMGLANTSPEALERKLAGNRKAGHTATAMRVPCPGCDMVTSPWALGKHLKANPDHRA